MLNNVFEKSLKNKRIYLNICNFYIFSDVRIIIIHLSIYIVN